MKNKLRILGLVVLAIIATWAFVRGCTPEPQPVAPPAAPERAAFHPSKPLRLVLIATRDAQGARADLAWLDYELRRLLTRGGMRLAPNEPAAGSSASDAFVLRVAVAASKERGSLALIAPDYVLERERSLEFKDETRLAVAQTLAKRLPEFLHAPGVSDWTALIGAEDARSYDALTRASTELLGPDAGGYTRPPPAPAAARTIERLEALTRTRPRFARARSLLAIGYLSLGGEDEKSLTQLAESTAERAIALDASLAEAHAALGLVAFRHNQWIAAHEHLGAALALDPDNAPALEGLACLMADAGHYEDARKLAVRVLSTHPQNIGASECLAYAQPGDEQTGLPDLVSKTAADAQVLALRAMLAGDAAKAERLLRESLRPQQFEQWARPVLRAARDHRQIPDALRAVTRAANDRRIDAATEILCGAGLKQSEFVFNRMARLQRERAHVPLRILWLTETAFLRRHARFEDIVGAAGLPAFWQEHGAPDVCAREPKTYGCKLTGATR